MKRLLISTALVGFATLPTFAIAQSDQADTSMQQEQTETDATGTKGDMSDEARSGTGSEGDTAEGSQAGTGADDDRVRGHAGIAGRIAFAVAHGTSRVVGR